MSIKSTRTITRSEAINRIQEINSLVAARNYRGIEATTFDPDRNLRAFVDNGVDASNLDSWTNSMLEDVMDSPFYRYSMFDNYFVRDDDDDEY